MALTDRQQGLTGGPAIKPACYVASTTNLVLSSTQVVDGIAVGSCERILVKDQTDAKENGIYIADSASWSRARDFDGSRDAIPGTFVYNDRGTLNGQTFWVFNSSSTAVSIDIGSTGDDIAVSQVTVALSGVSAFTQTLLGITSAASWRSTSGIDIGATLSDLRTAAYFDVLDEDNLGSNSSTALPTQQSVKAYVDNQPEIIRKTADESVTSSTAVQDDNELFAAVAANEIIYFTLQLRFSSSPTPGDLNIKFTAPSGSVYFWAFAGNGYWNTTPTWVQGEPYSTDEVSIYCGSATWRAVTIHGMVNNGATPDNLQLQWAQDTSNANPTVIRANSYLEVVRP